MMPDDFSEHPKLGLVVSYAPLEVGWDVAPALIDEACLELDDLPIDLIAADAPVSDTATALEAAESLRNAEVDAVVWPAATWAFDSAALEFLRVCDVPLLAWGVPARETGSVCGSQQLLEVLTELRKPCGFARGPVKNAGVHADVLAFARGAAAFQRLKRARFGMLGHRTMGMTEVAFHELDILRQFGSMVYYNDLAQLRDAMAGVDADAAEITWERVKSRCGACRVDDSDGITAARCYHGLLDWVQKAQLHGIAVGCYPDLMGVVCLGCGLLAEDGIVTGCEGDMNSTVLGAVLRLMSGRPVHNTDFLFADEDDNTCTMSHCGNSAISLAAGESQVALEHVRLMDKGVATQYPGAPGRVTIANLCGVRDTYRLTFYTGEAVPTGMTFPGIPVKVRLDVPLDRFFRETAEFGTGHHWIIAYGDLSAALAGFAQFAGLRTLTG